MLLIEIEWQERDIIYTSLLAKVSVELCGWQTIYLQLLTELSTCNFILSKLHSRPAQAIYLFTLLA